ncbi:MAG: TraR/DksA C4-type zinc finger protein [Gemmatimonadota bacterium]|nr:TraR/DksA C4-type zinc finger protein [Gemmatimonadota bacterium]
MTGTRQLTTKQLQQIEQELLGERARLERSMEMQSVDDAGAPATWSVASRVPASEEGGLALALASRTQARYTAIVDALTRLAAGTYGVCVGCTGRIPYGRLLVMPEATRCVTCGPRI